MAHICPKIEQKATNAEHQIATQRLLDQDKTDYCVNTAIRYVRAKALPLAIDPLLKFDFQS